MDVEKPRQTSPRGPVPVLRVALRWDGEQWSTIDVVRVPNMTLPRPDPADPATMAGFFVETYDDKGTLRDRQRLPDPLVGMEQFSGSGEITRLPHGNHAIDIEALVPDDEPASTIRLTRRLPRDREPRSVEVAIDRDRIRSYDDAPPEDAGHDHREGPGDHEGHEHGDDDGHR